VAAFRIDVHFIGDFMVGKRLGEEQGILYGHGGVGAGGPNKSGTGLFRYSVFEGQRFSRLLILLLFS
jgi:hypothetical protein